MEVWKAKMRQEIFIFASRYFVSFEWKYKFPSLLRKDFSNTTTLQKAYGERAKKINQIIETMKVVANLQELKEFYPNLEELKGDRAKTFSIRLTGNWRMIFAPYWEAENAENFLKSDGGINYSSVDCVELLSIEDYH